jgi:hypothetical protein
MIGEEFNSLLGNLPSSYDQWYRRARREASIIRNRNLGGPKSFEKRLEAIDARLHCYLSVPTTLQELRLPNIPRTNIIIDLARSTRDIQ